MIPQMTTSAAGYMNPAQDKITATSVVAVAESSVITAGGVLDAGLIDSWIRFAGVSAKSQTTYRTALRQLQSYFVAQGVSNPKRQDLECWRDKLVAENKSPATIQLYLTSTKIFFRWLAQENLYPNIADHLKARVKVNREHKKDALSSAQAGSLLQSVKGDSLKAKRDRAIIALMATTGLRCIEVNRADCGDIISQFGKTYLLVQGKGHSQKDARVLLPAQVHNLIATYLQARGSVNSSQPLFASTKRNKGGRLTTFTISKIVKAQMRACGLDSPRLTAHSLRHTAATIMLLAGEALPKVQQVLRHVNINTTMIYNNALERLKNQAEQKAADAIFNE